MICDRAKRRVGGGSAPVFSRGIFRLSPQGRLSYRGDILSPSRKNGLMIGDGRRRLRRSAFCRADPAGQPSPASRLRRHFWGSGVARPVILSGGFLSPSRKNGLMIGSADGGCAARLFVGLTLPGSPPPASRLRRLFWGQRGYFSAAKRGEISGAPGPAR